MFQVFTMSIFTSILIEDTVLLTVALIDTAVLAILLLIRLITTTSAVRTYILALLVFSALRFLFLHDQDLNIGALSVENFQNAQRRYQ